MPEDIQIISENLTLSDLQKELALPKSDQLFIDVRTAEEYLSGHIPGFLNFPIDHIHDFMAEFQDKDVVLSCASGVRAKSVAEMLHAEGHARSITEFGGGFKEWQAANLPIASEVTNPQDAVEKDYHPELADHKVHNGDDTLSKVRKNFTRTAGVVSHQVFDQAKDTFQGLEKQFVALPPLRQVFAILSFFILLSAVVSGVFGMIINIVIGMALFFSSITGVMFMTDWVQKMPWNKKP